ncbi:zinc transporter ZntB [Sphingobium sp. DEHP117]|uniref:zinc transporter ZntB n=1 Tax=Sphingobium sp. DEHP117 TaxID=2993436 RepID=UPI0027D7016E|nr:CorA family divalent cation transporter [Sphingobium sp. DEHP117]MDQ4421071.1 zinc transporter ZntB [Sphingobium sp. DEHP117]
MSRFFLHSSGGTREIELSACLAHDPEHEFLWVHLDGKVDDVDTILTRFAHIPSPAVAALKAQETRPRCAQFDEGALVNMRGLGAPSAIDGDPLVSIRFWAQRGLVVSLSYRELGVLDRLITRMLAGELRDPGDLIAATAIEITDALDPEIADLGDALDAIESSVLEDGSTIERQKVAQLRAEAISYRRFLAPQRQATERLMTMPADWLEPDDRLHLQEAADRCARMVEELESVRERAALTHEALTDLRAEHMNRQALVLAIVALVFLPLTFITGLLGMNVEGIPFAREPWAFWGVVAFCAFGGGAMAIWFKATRWLQK